MKYTTKDVLVALVVMLTLLSASLISSEVYFRKPPLVLQDDYAGPDVNISPPLKHAPGCSDFFLSKWKPIVRRTDCTQPWMKISCGEGYGWLITFEEQ